MRHKKRCEQSTSLKPCSGSLVCDWLFTVTICIPSAVWITGHNRELWSCSCVPPTSSKIVFCTLFLCQHRFGMQPICYHLWLSTCILYGTWGSTCSWNVASTLSSRDSYHNHMSGQECKSWYSLSSTGKMERRSFKCWPYSTMPYIFHKLKLNLLFKLY